ncbi:LysE family translocator [Donghicola eburneus]|uniref:LysE family translocator n=1 Tax=Donghicola eburneus TaxID=393278 RepID=UPI0008E3D45A|nr:LysE family translocator [Donghicola eburneus]SFQ57428.1 Threonine/homoserine/homoserine lactone efflux protein [Donghicola eburneus]
MLTYDVALTFIGIATLLAWVPGPDNLFVLTQSALCGSRDGILVTVGLCLGLVGHTVAVAMGVAVIFQQSEMAFSLLKYAGAAYLVYLAYQALRAKPERLANMGIAKRSAKAMILRGVVMNLTNPKVAIFFLAFLPQFTAQSRGSVAGQIMLLGGLFILCAFASFATISLVAGGLSRWLRGSPWGQTLLNRAAGVVFLSLAVKLATSQR